MSEEAKAQGITTEKVEGPLTWRQKAEGPLGVTPAQKAKDAKLERVSPKVRADGRKLRRLREERELSVRDLSERSGISTSTIYTLQRGRPGRTWAEMRTLERLAAALRVREGELKG